MINDFETERKKMEGFSLPLETPLINSNTREGEFYPIFRVTQGKSVAKEREGLIKLIPRFWMSPWKPGPRLDTPTLLLDESQHNSPPLYYSVSVS